MNKIKSFIHDYLNFETILGLCWWIAIIGIIVYAINSKISSSNTSSNISLNTSYFKEQKNETKNTYTGHGWQEYKTYRESLKENTTKNEIDKSELNNDEEFECDYILNKNTKKFHHTWCSSVNNMKKSNTKEFTGTRDEVIDMGYTPCKRCNP